MGHIYPEQQVKVVDGELWIKGDNVMKEYYKDPEHTAEVLEDGWFKTGDLVEFDDNDWIYITGRIKNLIILPPMVKMYRQKRLRNYSISSHL